MNKKYFVNEYECNKIFSKGRTSFTVFFIIKSIETKENHPRIGISVPKKNFKKAFIRNKIKRQIRSIFLKNGFKKGNHLIILKKKYNWKKDYFKLVDDFCNFAKEK